MNENYDQNYHQLYGDADRPEPIYQETYDLSGITAIVVGLIFIFFSFNINIGARYEYNFDDFWSSGGFDSMFGGGNMVLVDPGFNIDLLPDFFGYILIVVGLGKIIKYAADYVKARRYAGILLALSLFGMVYGFAFYAIGRDSDIWLMLAIPANITLGLINLICSILFILYLANGTAALYRRSGNFVWEAKCVFRRNLWLTLIIITWCVTVLAFILPELAVLLAIPLFIAGIIVMILLMTMVYHLKTCLHGYSVLDMPVSPYGRT